MTLTDRFRRRPKAELHVHLEGTLTRQRYRRWCRDDGVEPEGGPAPAGYRDAAEFLARYAEGCRRICVSPERVRTLVRDWAQAARRERIVYAELTVSPVIFEKLGLPWGEAAAAIAESLEEAERLGVVGRVLIDAVRQWGRASAEKALDLHQRHPLPQVVGFGLAGDERSRPTREFRATYERARSLGLRTTLHAGEWAGPESIRAGLDELAPDRIAHGIAAVRDPKLLRELVRRRIPLDVAPTSNLRTGAAQEPHPVRALIAAGARVTLSTDDPPYFGCTLAGEAARLAAQIGLRRTEHVLDEAFAAAFDPGAARKARAAGSRNEPLGRAYSVRASFPAPPRATRR